MDSSWLDTGFRQIPLTPFETALHRVALYSNPAWNLGDQYQKKMQEVWVKHNRIQEASKRLTAFDVLAGVAEGIPKTVRSVIPFSRLSQYGDFPYETGDRMYRSSVGHWRDSTMNLFRVKANDHRQGFGDFGENAVCFEEWISENVEAMFLRLQVGPCHVRAENTGEETRAEAQEVTSLNLSMVERSMTNRWTMYDSPFDLPSPLENWMKSQLQMKPNISQQQCLVSTNLVTREHTASWANVIVDMYPKFMDTLRNCRSDFDRTLAKNVPLTIDYEDVLRDPVSPLETYALCPPPAQTQRVPLVTPDLLSSVILWDRVSAQSIKEIWIQTVADGLLSSVFPTLKAILQKGAITLSTAYLADQSMLRYRLELGLQQGKQLVSKSDKGVQQEASNICFPQNPESKFRARNNNCSTEKRFRPPNHWRHKVFTGAAHNFRQTLIMPVADNQRHNKELEAEKIRSQEIFPHLNASGNPEANSTFWPPSNNPYRLPWNVVAQLPNQRVWNNLRFYSPGSMQIVHQQQYLKSNQPLLQASGKSSCSNLDMTNKKQFYAPGSVNHIHRKNHKAAAATTACTAKVIEILTRGKEVPTGTQPGHQRDAMGAAKADLENPIPVHVGCNASRKKPAKRESTIKLLTAKLEGNKAMRKDEGLTGCISVDPSVVTLVKDKSLSIKEELKPSR